MAWNTWDGRSPGSPFFIPWICINLETTTPTKNWLINFRDPQNFMVYKYLYIYISMFIWFFIPTSLGSVCHPLNFPKQPNLRPFFRTLRCKNGMRGRFFVKHKDDLKSTIEVIPQALEITEQNLWKGHVFTLTNFAKRSLKEELLPESVWNTFP